MSNYVVGSNLAYGDYLQAKSFVSDITTGQRAIQHSVSQQTRELIATEQELQAQNMHILGSGFEQMSGNMEQICCQLEDLTGALDGLNATFHWGFGQMLTGLGRLNDSLQELVSIAKTPAQTWAYNQYEIARDAMRKHLYPEALECLNRAINGYGDNPGYKLEYRFHQTRGLILLGNVDNCDQDVIDLPQSEQALLTAARYARTDYPQDAALAFFAAGWSAYCQNKIDDAAAYTQQSLNLHPTHGEALFQAAKINMHIDAVDVAFPFLKQAIEIDRNYSLKASADGDFQKHSERLNAFLDECRREARDVAAEAIRIAHPEIEIMTGWHAQDADGALHSQAISNLHWAGQCFEHGTFYGYLDANIYALAAIAAARNATSAQHSHLVRTSAQICSTWHGIRNRIRDEAPEHSPSAWAKAENKADRIARLQAPARSYEEWTDWIRQGEAALALVKEAEALTQRRAEECKRIKSENEARRIGAEDTALSWGSITFLVVGIIIYLVNIGGRKGGEMISAIIFGWIGAALIALVPGLVIMAVVYIAIKSGARDALILPGIRGHENDQLVFSLVEGAFEVQRRLETEGRMEAAGVVKGIDVVMNEEAGVRSARRD